MRWVLRLVIQACHHTRRHSRETRDANEIVLQLGDTMYDGGALPCTLCSFGYSELFLRAAAQRPIFLFNRAMSASGGLRTMGHSGWLLLGARYRA